MKATQILSSCAAAPAAIDPRTTVAEVVRRIPPSRPVLAKLGFETESGAEVGFGEACRGRRLDPETLGRVLLALDDPEAESPGAVELMSLAEICDRFEEHHHGRIREALKTLDRTLRDLVPGPGADARKMAGIRMRAERFGCKLADHLREERELLFPLIRRLDRAPAAGEEIGRLKEPLERMKEDHNEADEELAALVALAEGEASAGAPDGLRPLREALRGLEESLHGQIYQENQILFRRALAGGRFGRGSQAETGG